MKISTAEAAAKLGMHPSLLLFFLKEFGPSLQFEDIWPDVDSAWIETIAVSKGISTAKGESLLKSPTTVEKKERSIGLSDDAIRVIDKLRRHGNWGHISVPIDALTKLTHLSSRELNLAIDELRKHGFLDHQGEGKGTISLNSAKTQEIESIKTNT